MQQIKMRCTHCNVQSLVNVKLTRPFVCPVYAQQFVMVGILDREIFPVDTNIHVKYEVIK